MEVAWTIELKKIVLYSNAQGMDRTSNTQYTMKLGEEARRVSRSSSTTNIAVLLTEL